MPTTTTLNSAKAWHPDVQGFAAPDTIPTALVLQVGTLAGVVEGDQPAVRVPYVSDDGTAGFVAEGAEIPDAGATFDEAVITTNKVAVVGKFSREALSQPNAAALVVASMQRAVIAKADRAFLGNASAPAGLLTLAGISNGGAVGLDLDALADAVMLIEADSGTASHIIASPSSWGALSKLKQGTASTMSLVGAGTQAAERRLLGVPVLVSSAMPADTLLVADASSILTVFGQVLVARSDEAFFTSDTAAVRVTFRLGWGAMKPKRLVKLTTTAA